MADSVFSRLTRLYGDLNYSIVHFMDFYLTNKNQIFISQGHHLVTIPKRC